jgi:hypothetical protein
MNWKPSDKFMQVSAGLLLLTFSAFFLWRDTLKPISKGLGKEGMLSGHLKQGMLYLTGQGEQASEESVNREKEKLRREEQALQQKLEQLRRKREALGPAIPTKSPAGESRQETPNKADQADQADQAQVPDAGTPR